MKKIFLFFAMAMLIGACTPKPQPIDYGKEECAFCKMTIVSPQFASEVVTQKSKAFKYDAIECMLQAPQEDKVALHLVCDYLNEGNFIEASQATYLVSPNIESPMGGNLAAFSSIGKESNRNSNPIPLFTTTMICTIIKITSRRC